MSHEHLTASGGLPLNRYMENGEKDPAINGGETTPQAKGKSENSPQKSNRVSPELAKEMWASANGDRQISADERRTQNILIDMGVAPIAGAALDEEGENLLNAIRRGQVGRQRGSRKNPELKRIMMANGITEEEYNDKDLNDLLDLYVKREGGDSLGGAGSSESEEDKLLRLLAGWRETNANPEIINTLASRGIEPTPENIKKGGFKTKEELEQEAAGRGGQPPQKPPEATTAPEPEEPEDDDVELDKKLEERFREIFEKYGIDQEATEKIIGNVWDKDQLIEAGRRIFEAGITAEEHLDEQLDIFADVYLENVEDVDREIFKKAFKEWRDEAFELSKQEELKNSRDDGEDSEQRKQMAAFLEYLGRGYSPEEAARLAADDILPNNPKDEIPDDEKPVDERVSQKSAEQILEEFEQNEARLARENENLISELSDDELAGQVYNLRSLGQNEEEVAKFIKGYLKKNSEEAAKESLENYIRKSLGRLDHLNTSEEVRAHLDSIWRTYGNDLRRFDRKRYDEFLERRRLLGDVQDVDVLKKHGGDFISDVARELHGFGGGEKGRNRIEVNSAEQLFELIMDAEGTDWRTGGIFELIDKEGNLHEENFMAWIRYKITYFITDYSPDDPVNLMNEIAVETPYKNITFGTMHGTPKYFMRRDIRNANTQDQQSRIVNDPRLELLKNKALMEVWPMGENHNNDAQYRSAMGQGKALQEVLPKLHYKELYTKDRNRLNSFVRLPGIEDIEMRPDDALEGTVFQGDVGKTHQRSIVAYRYLPDRFMFRKTFNGGKDQIENSESLNEFYHSVIAQSFADRFKDLKNEKKQEYKDRNYGRSPDDEDVYANVLYTGSDMQRFLQELEKVASGSSIGADVPEDMKGSIRFFQLLNRGATNDRNMTKRGLGISAKEYFYLINNPEFFALKAITYKYANTRGINFSDLEVVDPKDPTSEFSLVGIRRRKIEEKEKEFAANEHTMSEEDKKKARFEIWKDREDLEKTIGRIPDLVEGVYDAFNIFSQVKREQGQIELVRKAISAGLLRQLQIDRDKKIIRYKAGMATLTQDDPEYQKKYDELQKIKVEELNPEDEDYEFKLRRLRRRQKLDAEYGTLWGAKEAYWTGISAFNDTNAIGFDKWSNEINTKDYRMRQGSGRGPFGLKDTVWGFRRLTFNFWDGLKVRAEGNPTFDRSLMSMIQGGDGDEMDLDKEIESFDFEGHAQRQWMVDHVIPAFKVADFLFDKHGMDLNKYFTRDHNGKLIIDKEKAQELIQDFVWHDLRYIIDQSGFNWNNKMRMWWREYDEKGASVVKFGTRSTEEYMFDPEVINMGMYGREGVPGGQGARARNAFAYQIMKEIAYHMRDAEGTYKWGLSEVIPVKKYFEEEWGYGQRPVDKKGNPVVAKKDENGVPLMDKEGNPILVALDKNGKTLYEGARVNRIEPAYKFFSDEEWEDKIAGPADAGTKKLKRNLWLSILWIFGISMFAGTFQEGGKTLAGTFNSK